MAAELLLPYGVSTITQGWRKVVIVGTGQVGMACALTMAVRRRADELVLLDADRPRAEGEALDLGHGLPFLEPLRVRSGDYRDAQGAQVVVITAGARRGPDESRLVLLQKNANILREIVQNLLPVAGEAVWVVVSNPVDVMSYYAWQWSGLPAARVVGSGTLLDTARWQTLLAQKLGVAPSSVHAPVLGEHGEQAVPLWSRVTVGGAPWDMPPAEREPLWQQVLRAGQEVIRRKGSTSYGIALAVDHLVAAILGHQERVLPVSCLAEGYYGLGKVYLSLLTVVNRQGVSRVVNVPLNERELAGLEAAARVLEQARLGIEG
ncbi:MAG: L-lactate dehydrogenase [Gloeomargarita sp. DG02_4_bins_56]